MALKPATGQYAGMAQTWAADAALVYGPLARHLVARVAGAVRGALALDAGAGSGVAGSALRERGARVVAVDREPDMAAYGAQAGPALAGDVTALPFRSGAFDVAVAAFVLNHLTDPVAGLGELRRVTRSGGTVLASTYSDDRAAAKDAVDQAALAHGFVQPDWYTDLQRLAHAVGSEAAVRAALAEAGFTDARVIEEPVDVGTLRPEDIVRYRLAIPHLHRFAESLSEDRRAAFVADAVERVSQIGDLFAPIVIEVVAVA